ncbi:MAG: 3-deoxy-manno-octulosonate cytidylyltransferase [Proteobacteria bacterium]|nr:3-deoxy-manno-octulosonate cytidylyltransferase [Pseudomonadota bacterium]
MNKICIIPARMGSSRFPGKPLKKALNIPVIIHVAKRCLLSEHLNYVAVATCDKEIENVCHEHNIPVILTSPKHERCTDRVSEAIEKLSFSVEQEDLIIMVQGDEILVTPNMIDMVIRDYEQTHSPVINLLSKLYRESDHQDPNVVKVVSAPDQRALYFSRSPIPSTYRDKNVTSYQQTGVIGFSRKFLKEFSELPQTPLEKIESIDMLRVLEHSLPLRVVYTEKETVAVDVPYDLERAEKILHQDEFVKRYA